jgi:hypothetical protein
MIDERHDQGGAESAPPTSGSPTDSDTCSTLGNRSRAATPEDAKTLGQSAVVREIGPAGKLGFMYHLAAKIPPHPTSALLLPPVTA